MIKTCCLFVLALFLFSAFGQLSNIKIINDNLPDYTDILSLVNSVKGNWQTDEEKAMAALKWVAWGRHQAGKATDEAGSAILDPVLGYNHYGIHNCGPTSAFMAAIGQGLGFVPNTYCCYGHTLIDLTWGGKKHLLDAAFGFVFVNKATREIAGFYDLRNAYRDGGGTVAGNPMLDPLQTSYFCPITTYPVPNGISARMGYSLYEESNRYIQGEYKEFFWDDAASFDTTVNPSCYGVNLRGYRYTVNLKPYESYTRYFHTLGSTQDYYLPVGGVDPNLLYTGYGIRNCRSNGQWDLKPDFGAADYGLALFASTSLEQDVASPLVHPSAAGVTADMTLKVDAANPITSARITGSVVRGNANDVVRLLLSVNSGSTWQTLWTGSGTGVLKPSVTVNTAIAHKYGYLVKLEMSSA
jgi:hypothetical protein